MAHQDQRARLLAVRLKPDVDDALREWCENADRSLSWAVNQAVRSWLALDPVPQVTRPQVDHYRKGSA